MKKLLLVLILSVCIPITLLAQKTIKGKVSDDAGQPAASVTVTLKGSKKGTQTDKNGNFSLSVPASGTVELQFSSTEFNKKTVAVSGDEVTVQLVRVVTTGDDVVVVGYQSIKRRELTAPVSSVSA